MGCVLASGITIINPNIVRIFELDAHLEVHMTGTSRVWLITGVSSGFGLELARAVLGRGDTVVGTVRQAAQVAGFESLVPGRAHGRISGRY